MVLQINAGSNFADLVSECLNFCRTADIAISKLDAEVFIEKIFPYSEFATINELVDWFFDCQKEFGLKTEVIRLDECRGWDIDKESGSLRHVSNDFFTIDGIRVHKSPTREVENGWDQPLLTQVGFDGGILGLIRVKFNGIPHYLFEAKAEPGNPDLVQISPTLQATFANLKRSHGGRKPHFYEFFEEDLSEKSGTVLFDQWFSEDGGRLNKKRNKGIIIEWSQSEVGECFDELPPGFNWLTLFQIRHFLRETSWVSPHVRSLVAAL